MLPSFSCSFYVNVTASNQEPTVTISNCPSGTLTSSSYTFSWSGSDSDGSIRDIGALIFSNYELGDCSQDNNLNVLDVIFIINNCIFGNEDICQECSDIDGNNIINVLDVILLVNIILGSDSDPSMGDMNGDGGIDILDVILLVNIILGG